MSECLILPCCKKKVADPDGKPLPAIETYDGVLARVIRKRNPGVDTFFVSSKYGLISKGHMIEPYDLMLSAVLDREFVIEKVANQWIAITSGVPDKYDTIWHVTRGAYYDAIKILEHWTTMKHVVAKDVDLRHNIGVILRELKAFCEARPAYSDIDLDHLVEMYKQAQAEGKV